MLRSHDAATPHELIHWHVGDKGGQWAVRQGDWKLIGNAVDSSGGPLSPEDKRLFLVNLAEDSTERQNLAAEHPETVSRLKKAHEDWFAEVEGER